MAPILSKTSIFLRRLGFHQNVSHAVYAAIQKLSNLVRCTKKPSKMDGKDFAPTQGQVATFKLNPSP